MTTFLLRTLILLGIVCQAYGVFANPEIDVKGRNVSISNGDFSPITDDNTNFNRQYTLGGTTSLTFTIHNTGSLPLTLSGNPSISGTNAGDFSLTAAPSLSIATGTSTSFTITFNPSADGTRNATITINNNDGDEGTYTFGIAGVGQSSTQVRWVNNEGASRPSAVTLQGVTYNVAATSYTDIQTAINAAVTDDIVYITEGVYRNPNEISSTSCTFSGTGQQFNLYLTIADKGITLTSPTGNHCTSDVRLVGYGIFFDNAHNTVVQGIHLDSVRVNGFWDTNAATSSPYVQSNNLKILNNKVTNTRGHGMKTDTGGPTGAPINRGARDIIGNYFENIGFYDGRGNCMTPAPVTALWLGEAGNSFVIANNVINNTKWAGILCDGYGGYQDIGTSAIVKGAVTITGNRINNTVDAGIQIGFSSGTAGFYPLEAYITHNTITNANTSNSVSAAGICILSSNVKGKNITYNDVSSSFNGLSICIAGWEGSSATNFTYVNHNNFYNLSGGFGVTHIAGILPNGLYNVADNLLFYSFENNYWGASNGPTYTTNPSGTGVGLRKETVAQSGTVYSTNDFYFTPYATTPNTVNSASLACCQTPSADISYPLATYCSSASPVTVIRTGTGGGVYTVSPAGLSINGDNGTITPSTSSLGTYTVTYRIGASCGCALFTTTTTVTIAAPPTAYNVTGGGTFCANAAGVPVGLANSQTGVSYQLKVGGVNTGGIVAGSTGNAISFGNQTVAGIYTVVGANTCSTNMSGSVNVATIAASSVTLAKYGGITSGAGVTTITQACVGSPITLAANVSGPTVTGYQWQRNGADLVGQTNDSITVTSGWGVYRVRILNTNNCSTNADTFAISFRSLPNAQAGSDKNVCAGSTATLGTTNNASYTYSWHPSTNLSNATISNPTVTINTGTATYTVYVSQVIANSGGLVCSKSDEVVVNTLTIPASPSISVTAPAALLGNTSPELCEGSGAITLSASNTSGATHLQWLKNGVQVTLSTNVASVLNISNTGGVQASYTARVKSSNGCFSLPSNTINTTIKSAALPTITPAGTNNIILLCFASGTSASQILTANVASGSPTYAWYQVPNPTSVGSGNNYTATVSNAISSKTFQVKATYGNGCIRTSANKIVRKNTTCREGMINETDNIEVETLSVYPNPSSNQLQVSIHHCNSTDGVLTLTNTLGEVVSKQNISLEEGSTSKTLAIADLAAGVYYLTFDTKTTHQVVKVVKE